MAKFVYLDESGDTGFKLNSGSSSFFVVTLLLVDDPIPFQSAITRFREEWGLAVDNEIKFYRSSGTIRTSFLQMLRRQNFAARVLVIDKRLITQPHMRQRETFYNFLVQMILRHDNGSIQDAILILDESVQDERSKQALTTYLRQSLNSTSQTPKIRTVRYHDSRADNLIQAADMVSGAVYAAYHRNNTKYMKLIRLKIADLWEWRPHTQ